MTIVTSLDYKPTFRERQEYEVMMELEKAITSGASIDTHDLAVRIVHVLSVMEPPVDDDTDDFDPSAYAAEKPRIRVPANSGPVARSGDLDIRAAVQGLLDSLT